MSRSVKGQSVPVNPIMVLPGRFFMPVEPIQAHGAL